MVPIYTRMMLTESHDAQRVNPVDFGLALLEGASDWSSSTRAPR